jgi:hypothetical protein
MYSWLMGKHHPNTADRIPEASSFDRTDTHVHSKPIADCLDNCDTVESEPGRTDFTKTADNLECQADSSENN